MTCEYPSFVRRQRRFTPYWRDWKPGERRYVAHVDAFWVCTKPTRTLEVDSVKAAGQPDAGDSPLQRGWKPESLGEHWLRERLMPQYRLEA